MTRAPSDAWPASAARTRRATRSPAAKRSACVTFSRRNIHASCSAARACSSAARAARVPVAVQDGDAGLLGAIDHAALVARQAHAAELLHQVDRVEDAAPVGLSGLGAAHGVDGAGQLQRPDGAVVQAQPAGALHGHQMGCGVDAARAVGRALAHDAHQLGLAGSSSSSTTMPRSAGRSSAPRSSQMRSRRICRLHSVPLSFNTS